MESSSIKQLWEDLEKVLVGYKYLRKYYAPMYPYDLKEGLVHEEIEKIALKVKKYQENSK